MHPITLSVLTFITATMFCSASNAVCDLEFHDPQVSNGHAAYDPEGVLRKNGHDPSKLKIQRGEGEFAVIHDGKDLVGLLTFSFYGSPLWWEINVVKLKREFKHRGIGTLLYLYAAKQIFDATGRVLQMSSDMSKSSRKLWQHLLAVAYADTFPNSNKAFIKSSILRDGTLIKVNTFFDSTVFDGAHYRPEYDELSMVDLSEE